MASRPPLRPRPAHGFRKIAARFRAEQPRLAHVSRKVEAARHPVPIDELPPPSHPTPAKGPTPPPPPPRRPASPPPPPPPPGGPPPRHSAEQFVVTTVRALVASAPKSDRPSNRPRAPSISGTRQIPNKSSI